MGEPLKREYSQAEKDDAWNSVYSPMRTAMNQVAIELGGEDLSDKVIKILESDTLFPYLAVVNALRAYDPDASRLVVELNGRMNDEAYSRERATLDQPEHSSFTELG